MTLCPLKTGGWPLMYGLCPICRHSQRASIDERLCNSRELRPLADEFGVRITALRYHRDEHLAGLASPTACLGDRLSLLGAGQRHGRGALYRLLGAVGGAC